MVGDLLFVAGGAGGDGDEDETWKTVESYDPTKGEWKPVASMLTERAFFGMAALDGKIYAAGGTMPGRPVYDTAEVYDPAAPEKGWTEIARMRCAAHPLLTHGPAAAAQPVQ